MYVVAIVLLPVRVCKWDRRHIMIRTSWLLPVAFALTCVFARHEASAAELSAADLAWIDKCIADRAIEQHDPDQARAYCTCMHGIVEDNEPFTPMELERAYPPAHVMCMRESGLAR